MLIENGKPGNKKKIRKPARLDSIYNEDIHPPGVNGHSAEDGSTMIPLSSIDMKYEMQPKQKKMKVGKSKEKKNMKQKEDDSPSMTIPESLKQDITKAIDDDKGETSKKHKSGTFKTDLILKRIRKEQDQIP